jgi:hypothetical protein
MREKTAVACLLLALVPRVLAAQASGAEQTPGTPDDKWARRFSVHVVAGATLTAGNDAGGNVQSVSIGYAPTPKLMVLVSGWRTHNPTNVRYFSDGSSATRGGTLQFVSGEVRFALRSDARVSPYAMAGAGLGVSRPNVNEIFPDPVTNDAVVLLSGGGVVVLLGPHLRLSGEVGFLLVAEGDGIQPIMPIRAGLAWRF